VKTNLKNYLFVFAFSLVTFFIDRISKNEILSIFEENNLEKIFINPFLDLFLVFNTGISYGLLGGESSFQKWLLIIVSVSIVAFLLLWVKDSTSRLVNISFSFITGGALGNILDRILYGGVIDFISLHAYGYYWYIFNIADVFIVFGVILFLIKILMERFT
jgi:signal peptidase II|tara:strand:- start:4822 stop:5304 length:483 start_codon:yes stop_codon:yes gene_type:complete